MKVYLILLFKPILKYFSDLNFLCTLPGCVGAAPHAAKGRYECPSCALKIENEMTVAVAGCSVHLDVFDVACDPCRDVIDRRASKESYTAGLAGGDAQEPDMPVPNTMNLDSHGRQSSRPAPLSLTLGDLPNNVCSLSLFARASAATVEVMRVHSGFTWRSPFQDTSEETLGRHGAMSTAAFKKRELTDKAQRCVREFVRRGAAGIPQGYSYFTYTLKAGFEMVSARELPSKTLVALYHGSLISPSKPVFTNTLVSPTGSEDMSEPPFFVEAETSGGFGRFLGCSSSPGTANVAMEPCVVDGHFMHVMFTTKVIPAHTRLRWYYGDGYTFH